MLSTKNLRTLGYLKITSLELELDDIIQLGTELRGVSSKPWSYLDDWLLGVKYEAMNTLIECILPDLEMPKQEDKRIFRNTWEGIWKAYCSDLGFNTSIQTVLSETGIALAYQLSLNRKLDSLEKNVLQFYSDILNWYSFTKKSNFDTMEVLKILVTDDMENLRGYMKKCL